MNWRWLLFDYADPSIPLSFAQRVRVAFRRIPIWKLSARMRRGRYLMFAATILPVAIPNVLSLFVHVQVKWTPLLAGTVFVTYMPALWLWFCLVYGWTCKREHFYRISLEGFDVCLDCGYWLRGLCEVVKQCPECGAEREPMKSTSPEKPT